MKTCNKCSITCIHQNNIRHSWYTLLEHTIQVSGGKKSIEAKKYIDFFLLFIVSKSNFKHLYILYKGKYSP